MKKIVIALVPFKGGEGIVSIYMQDKQLIDISVQSMRHESLQGNIYVGRVERVLDNLQAAFIRVQDGQMVYLPLKGVEQAVYKTPSRKGFCKGGDELLIQIDQDAQKMKLPHGSLNLTISGRYLVCSSGRKEISYSAKLSKEDRKAVRQHLPEDIDRMGLGWIVRTGAVNADEADLREEAGYLAGEMKRILQYGTARPCGALLYEEKTEWERLVQKYCNAGDTEIVTDIPEIAERLRNSQLSEKASAVRVYEDPLLPLYKLYSIETICRELTDSRVWFGDGPFLVIEETEAFVVIDINSGKYTKKQEKEAANLAINLAAMDEIVRQIKLRRLSGTVLIDVINMKDARNRECVTDYMKKLLKANVSGAQVIDLTPIQIMEITRKKEGPSLKEMIGNCQKKL